MISITKFKELAASIHGFVPAITAYHVVSHEGHAIKRLADQLGIQMLILYPSADREGKAGAGIDLNATWIFILEKDDNSQSNDQEEEQYERLQEVILKIRGFIETQAETDNFILQRYEPSRTKIDPEYREFGGWNGWSMSIVF